MLRLIDSDILIDHLRGRPEALGFLVECLDRGDQLQCSVITHAELFAGLRAGEEGRLRKLLALLEAVPVSPATAEHAGRYRRDFGRSHGVELPDALIAATTFLEGAELNTTNTRHYPMTDIRVARPY